MATVKETLEAEIVKLQAELAALPTEMHTIEASLWVKIKAFFHANPAAAAPAVASPLVPPVPPAPPAA